MYHPVVLTLAHVPIWLLAIMLTRMCPSLALFVSSFRAEALGGVRGQLIF